MSVKLIVRAAMLAAAGLSAGCAQMLEPQPSLVQEESVEEAVDSSASRCADIVPAETAAVPQKLAGETKLCWNDAVGVSEGRQ